MQHLGLSMKAKLHTLYSYSCTAKKIAVTAFHTDCTSIFI